MPSTTVPAARPPPIRAPQGIVCIDVVSQKCLQRVREFLILVASIRFADTNLRGGATALGA